MIAFRLLKIYERLLQVGLVRSKRDFARNWLGRGKTYLRDYEFKIGRAAACVPAQTVEKLHARISALAALVPARIANDLRAVMREIERDAQIAKMLRR